MVFIYIFAVTLRDVTLADQRTCVYRYRQLIFTHCKHNLSQEHLLMLRNYQQLAPSVQFENQLASSLYSVGFILPGSWSTVGFITRDFHALISRQHSQTNRRGLYTLFLTSKSQCIQKISSVDALLSTQNVLSRSGRFGGDKWCLAEIRCKGVHCNMYYLVLRFKTLLQRYVFKRWNHSLNQVKWGWQKYQITTYL